MNASEQRAVSPGFTLGVLPRRPPLIGWDADSKRGCLSAGALSREDSSRWDKWEEPRAGAGGSHSDHHRRRSRDLIATFGLRLPIFSSAKHAYILCVCVCLLGPQRERFTGSGHATLCFLPLSFGKLTWEREDTPFCQNDGSVFGSKQEFWVSSFGLLLFYLIK